MWSRTVDRYSMGCLYTAIVIPQNSSEVVVASCEQRLWWSTVHMAMPSVQWRAPVYSGRNYFAGKSMHSIKKKTESDELSELLKVWDALQNVKNAAHWHLALGSYRTFRITEDIRKWKRTKICWNEEICASWSWWGIKAHFPSLSQGSFRF